MTEQKKTRIYLTTKENYRLCDYLMKNPPCPGESFEDIMVRADSELHIENMNAYHVRNRLSELELPLIPGTAASSELAALEARISVLEKALLDTTETNRIMLERLSKAESAIAAHKLAIQGIGRDNVGAMNALNDHKWPDNNRAGRPSLQDGMA